MSEREGKKRAAASEKWKKIKRRNESGRPFERQGEQKKRASALSPPAPLRAFALVPALGSRQRHASCALRLPISEEASSKREREREREIGATATSEKVK